MSKQELTYKQTQGSGQLLPIWQRINKEQMLLVGSAVVVDGLVDVAMHFDKTGVFLGLLAVGAVAKHSKDIVEWVVPGSNPGRVRQATANVIDTVAPVNYIYADQSTSAKLKRLFGIGGTNTDLYVQVPVDQPPEPAPQPKQETQPASPAPTGEQKKQGKLEWGVSVKFSTRFDPPINHVLGKGMLITGCPGAGKSNLIGHTFTCAAKHDIPCLLVDYKNEFYPLRDILQTCILIGHPDYAEQGGSPYYPLTLDNVVECAEMLIDNCYQAVFCVPSYPDLDEMAETLAALLHALVDYQVSLENEDDRLPFLIFTDEAHNFVPEKDALSALPLEAKNFKLLKKAYVKAATLGRSYGCTMIHATQRLANIGKWAVGTLQIQIIMKQDLDNDIDRCEEYVGKGHRDELRNLPPGRGFVRGLSKNPMLVQFDQQKARHVSKTPDLARIQKKMKRDPRLPVSRVLAKRIPGTNQYELPHRDPSSGVPAGNQKPNLSVVPPQTGTPQGLPGMDVETPAERAGLVPDVFQPGPDDLLLSGLQIKLLIIHYEETHNIKESLQQIRNEKGQGLGSRYSKHASFILEQRGLKKRGA